MAMLHNAAHVWHDRLQPNPSEGASAAAGSGSGGGGSCGGGGGVLASRGNKGDAAASAPYWYLSPQMLDDFHRLNHPWLTHIFEGVYVLHARARRAHVLRFACAGRVRVRGGRCHAARVRECVRVARVDRGYGSQSPCSSTCTVNGWGRDGAWRREGAGAVVCVAFFGRCTSCRPVPAWLLVGRPRRRKRTNNRGQTTK